MFKICNVVISVLFSLVLIGPALVLICEKAPVDIPSWATAEDAKWLSGGIKDAHVKNFLSLDGFESGEFQEALSEEVENRIPLKATAMKANAKLQRACIELANVLCKWNCYPARFGSDVLVVPDERILVGMPRKPYQENTEAVSGIISMLSSSKANNKSVRFVFDVVSDTYSSEGNPAHTYVTGSYDSDWVAANIVRPLGESGVDVVLDSIVSEEELIDEWHTTEHHWRIQRALSSYNAIGNALEWEELQITDDELIAVADSWYGSNARTGLDFEYEDYLNDIPILFDNLQAYENGKPVERGLRLSYLKDRASVTIPVFDVYHAYYGQPKAEVIYTNDDGKGKGSCLFIEQSYGVPLEPYIAHNYSTTVCISPMNATVKKTLDEYIEEYDIDDVVIQLGYTNMYLAKSKSPIFYNGTHAGT